MELIKIWIDLSEDWKISQIKYNSNECNNVIEITKNEFEKLMNSSIPYQIIFKELENKYINNET
jgi:hypothetical protein